jgi:arylsulfatase A-like enzyme
VEIRDILPTCLAAAGKEPHIPVDGRSLLSLVEGGGEAWRPWIDLEHNICYDKTNHWNALTDGKTKYIYHAFDGQEQLFDLPTDPGEENDLAGDSGHTDMLQTWRSRLVDHLQPRGPEWVKEGNLVPRPENMNLSPNYPVTENNQ